MTEQKPAQGRLIARIVFGVFGNQQHGKDTVSDLICEEVRSAAKMRARKIALADPLKVTAMHLLGMPAEVAFGNGISVEEREKRRLEWAVYGRNARQWLRWIGTELRNQIDQDLWIDRLVRTVVDDDQGTAVWAISDCRFNNEREKLPKKFADHFVRFVKVRVKRDWPVDLSHPSESEVAAMSDDVFDAVLVNDGDLEALRQRVRALLRNLSQILA